MVSYPWRHHPRRAKEVLFALKLSTKFPLATLFFKHWSADDREVGVVVPKARIRRGDDDLWRAEPEPSLATEDVFSGDPALSSLATEQEVAPGKVGTDLIIRATARCPDRTPASEWPVSVSIPDRLFYSFQVQGPSVWKRDRLRGWRRTTPELVSEVPLTYEMAFGGASPGPDGTTLVHEDNPAGIGFATRERLAANEDFAAPQIGLLAEFMGGDPLAEMTVCDLGPIAKSWPPRRSEAGTFDAAWQKTRHPRMPSDYSLAFWNAAPTALQLDPPLVGNEEIIVHGIAHDGPVTTVLPGVACAVLLADGARIALTLDMVALDLSDPDPAQHTADLVWRNTVEEPERFQVAEVIGERV